MATFEQMQRQAGIDLLTDYALGFDAGLVEAGLMPAAWATTEAAAREWATKVYDEEIRGG